MLDALIGLKSIDNTGAPSTHTILIASRMVADIPIAHHIGACRQRRVGLHAHDRPADAGRHTVLGMKRKKPAPKRQSAFATLFGAKGVC
ncbi:hypothetical protein [Thauera humireducens]|uniref:Uncharacterized protein n=1 Tax=Thauera humireducens TaxID=1134435 RepID=A0A127K7Z5_9RHOO|nr:hypothetical protein [Thauera humireducens]AMO38090.1 hypothetical protein AC731_014775 [Thauera humireducens]